MKITAVFLLGICLQAAAAGHAQRITYNAKDVTLDQVLTEVKKQTGYDFILEDAIGDEKIPVVKSDQLPLEQFLSAVLSPLKMNFIIRYQTVFVHSKPEAKEVPTPPVETPPITVKGTIVNEKGEPTAASVVVKGTKNGVTTDAYGNFELNNVPDNATLVISGVSIETQEIKINGRAVINISVITKVSSEEEVTISTGYWSSSKRKSVMNITKIGAKDIQDQPVTSPLAALIGKVPGIEITPANGVASAAPAINIRGFNSIRPTGGYPLYIVDGVVIDSRPILIDGGAMLNKIDPLTNINPASIESIEVLKDGAATAIYGSRGANGVIIITTKKGASHNGTAVSLNYYTGIGQIANFMDVLNTKQYLEMRREAISNDGGVVGDFDYDINGTWDTTRNINWQKELLGGASHINNAQLTVSGGNERTTFRINGSYYKEGSILPVDFYHRNISGSFDLNHASENRKFNIGFTTNLGSSQNIFASEAEILSYALNLPPNAPKLYDENGELNFEPVSLFGGTYTFATFANPLAELRKTQETKSLNLISSIRSSYQLLPELLLKANIGITSNITTGHTITPLAAMAPGSITQYVEANASFSDSRRTSVLFEPQLVYAKKFHINHEINIVAGASVQQTNYYLQTINGNGYKSDALLNSPRGAPRITYGVADEDGQYRYIAGFGRIGYAFKDKYLLDLTGRRDGSSRFGPNNRFGNFWAIGAGWVFTNEKLFNDNSLLSFGKIRGSIATTGNDQIGDYKYYNLYAAGLAQYRGLISLFPTALFNPDYQWEITKKTEVALELGLLNNRITFEAAWYRNKSSNQLVNYTLPATTGFDGVLKNFEAVIENSGIELMLTTRNISRKHFSWSTSVNFSVPRNKLVEFEGIETSSYRRIYRVGEPITVQRLYHFTGVDPTTGVYTFEDRNNDGNINEDDQFLLKPTSIVYYGGISNTVRYESWELGVVLQLSKQPQSLYNPALPGFRGNQPLSVMDRWRKEGDITTVQRYNANFMYSTEFSNYQNSDAVWVSPAFMRLRTMTLSYNASDLPWLTRKLGLDRARIYLQGQNIFTWTDYPGLDPQTGNSLPQLRTFTLGVELNF